LETRPRSQCRHTGKAVFVDFGLTCLIILLKRFIKHVGLIKRYQLELVVLVSLSAPVVAGLYPYISFLLLRADQHLLLGRTCCSIDLYRNINFINIIVGYKYRSAIEQHTVERYGRDIN
jgi:hypothetical protein